MSETHDTGDVRPVNHRIALFIQEFVIRIRVALGGVIPTKGRFTATVWAMWFGNEPQTIRAWVVKYNIPHKRPGEEMIIDAEDLWGALPYCLPNDEAPRKRGGNRRGPKD